MAAANAVWGIDIGQCALKALRCTLADDGQTLQAEAFDYIEYPKILTQPDANPEQLIQDALRQFLANNSIRDSRVAISVSGQSGLSRFIKLPPVESKKIPDIVKYEAKQQIPFSLDDVIWDYQPLLGGMQDDGVALETEVGLFAMKREQVFRALRPFRDAGIELDIVQLTPICIYNAVTYGVLNDLPSPTEYDPDNPPASVVVISMGTDTTDLVVTNGFRIWQRSIPIGGSHFTKQLTKEMKLTFAKAEHLKRNAREAEDPKAVFQAMRPVFNDLVQELQRSIGYFRSIDRRAQITQGVALGNAMRLPGLQPYIEKNLEIPIRKVQEFEHLTGSSVISTPKFKDNILSFPVSYGLCIQGLGKGRLSTNLIPRELVNARLIRRKKPWAVLALSLFLLGIGLNFVLMWNRWSEAHPDSFKAQAPNVRAVSSSSQEYISKDQELQQQFQALEKLGDEVVGGADARFIVLELLKAIDVALPREEGADPFAISKTPYLKRQELFIESIDSEYFPTLSTYFTPDVRDRHTQFLKDLALSRKQAEMAQAPAAEGAPDATVPAPGDVAAEESEPPLEEELVEEEATPEVVMPEMTQPGWVIQIQGFHFHNDDIYNQRATYVMTTLLDSLENASVQLPAGPGQPLMEFTMKEMGIHCPILAAEGRDISVAVPNPNYKPPDTIADTGERSNRRPSFSVGNSADPTKDEMIAVPAYEFTVQFIWIETRASQRLEQRRQQQATPPTAADEFAGDF